MNYLMLTEPLLRRAPSHHPPPPHPSQPPPLYRSRNHTNTYSILIAYSYLPLASYTGAPLFFLCVCVYSSANGFSDNPLFMHLKERTPPIIQTGLM